MMKSRLFIRTLCVGAALLIPAGGLAALGVGTAGATTITLGSPSKASLGAFGTMTLVGKVIPGSTGQVSITTIQANITATGKTGLKALIVAPTKVLITTASITFKTVQVVIKNTGFTHCEILLPNIGFTHTAGTKYVATGLSLSSATIKTSGGTCTKKTTLTTDFKSPHTLSGTITK
jgi:hypothetical protein